MLQEAVESTQQLRDLRDKLEREIGEKERRMGGATVLQEAVESTQQLRDLRDKLECEISEEKVWMGELEHGPEKDATAGP